MNGIIILIIFLVIIWLILLGIAKNESKNIGQIFMKSILVILITTIGWAITCGGNLQLYNTLCGKYYEKTCLASTFIIGWYIEVGVVFILAVWFSFFRKGGYKQIWGKLKI